MGVTGALGAGGGRPEGSWGAPGRGALGGLSLGPEHPVPCGASSGRPR